MTEGKTTYVVRVAITPENVDTLTVRGVEEVDVEGGILTLKGGRAAPGKDRTVLLVVSNGTWADCLEVPSVERIP